MRRTLSVRLSVCLSVRPVIVFVYFTVEPSYERTSKIEKTSVFAYGPAYVLFGTQRGPHIVRPSRPHKFLFIVFFFECVGVLPFDGEIKMYIYILKR